MKKMKWLAVNFEEILSGVAFGVMICIVVANVSSRYLFGKSFIYAEEMAYIGCAYSMCLGLTVLFKRNAMIAIEILVDNLPEKIQKYIRIFNYSLLLLVNLFLLYVGIDFAVKSWGRPMTALRIPYTFMNMAIPVSFGLMAFYSARFLYTIFHGGRVEETKLEDQR